ncbi:MAG: phosphatase PAP2 family protein [Bifidobacterium psychraerophilum]|jgi:undecaprenyl-diphosphatase|uniref:phosphatase PAP2 family protein n=2 Tax=Bifidobacterium psychraerophilum TaxID=218140 RepID=UPI0023F7790C|nr:phosphatase PAP2 family protein [Bifidobacterium psychraerophilum]MCI2181835.1 phosphatase PAP2 family protein [Bifidobacterium psychraerophilum]
MIQMLSAHLVPVRQWSARVWVLVSMTVVALVCAVPFGRSVAVDPGFDASELRIISEFQQAAHGFHVLSAAFGQVFSPPVVVCALLLMLGIIQWGYHDWGETLRGMVMVLLPLLAVLVIKILVDRPRPATALGSLVKDPSFPSGHTAGAVCLSVVILFAIRLHKGRMTVQAEHRWIYMLAYVLLAVIPVCTAMTRLVLGVHYPSDVIASLVLCPLISGSIYAITR